MLIGDMEIRLRADIARLQRDMDSARQVVGNATNQISRAADTAKAALAGIGAGIGLSQIIQMTDAYAKFTAQLRLASTSAREYAAAYADVKRISTAAQQDLQATGMLYARIANGTRELGTTQKQVAAITETVNMALKVSGATAQESASAQLQLSQAFASGTLRGEEFNAVNEAAPRLMLALADGIGVPVGALKKMAEAGEITSKIMADVLPNALEKLRVEAKEVQTIAGAFTVLKNNMMEFVGIQANASGGVAMLTGAIGLLASNLGLLAGSLLTVIAVKSVNWLAGMVTQTYANITANRALLASNLATAQSNVTAAAAASALAAARVTELRAAVLASSGAVQLAITMNGLIPAQARAAAAAATHTAALAAQTTAMGAASVAGGIMRGALAFLGGPIGAITALLSIGATAWMVWGNKGSEAEKQVTNTLADEIDGYLANLNKQIDKLKERNELAGKGMTTTADPVTDGDKKREQIMAEINRIGKQGDLDITIRTELLKQWGGRLNQLTIDTEAFGAAQQKNKDLVFDKKEAEWLGKNGTAAQKMAFELAELQKEFGRVTPAMEAFVKAKHADKGAAKAITKEATAYQNLVTSIGEKIAANKLEMSGYDKLSDAQKMTIKLDEAIASGKNKLTPKHTEEARALIATVAAQDGSIASHKRLEKMREDYAKSFEMIEKIQEKTIEDAIKEAEKNEELARTFGMTKGAIEQLELARLEEQLAQRASTGLTVDEIAQLEKLIDAKKRSADASTTLDQMEVAKKAADDAKAEWKKAAESIEQSLTDALMRGFESGKSFGRNLMDTLKNMFKTLILQPTIKGILAPVSGAISAAFTPGAAQAADTGSSALGMASNLGSTISAAGTLMGSAAVSSFGAGLSAGWAGTSVAGAASAYGAAGMSGVAGGLTAGSAVGGAASSVVAGASTVLAAIPVWGWIAIAALAIAAYFDNSGTAHTGAAASASASGVNAIDVHSLGFAPGTATSAETQSLVNGLASGIVGILDSTALAFGKTAGYTAATAFADDTSKDGAWGALMISKLGETVVNWADTKQPGSWAPKDFADGKEGQAQYLTALSASVRTALNGIGLPEWAQEMLDGLKDGASMQEMSAVVGSINTIQYALTSMGEKLVGFAGMSGAAATALMGASGGIEALVNKASVYYDIFYDEGERAAVTTKQITDALAAVNIAMPATREAFRAQVEAQLALGVAGAPAVAVLLGVAGAFAQVVPAADATAAAVTTVAQALDALSTAQQDYDSAVSDARSAMSTAASQYQAFVDAVTTAQGNLASSRAAIADQYRSAVTAEMAAKKSVADAQSAITAGYVNASDKLAAVQQKIADSFAKVGTSLKSFLEGLDSAGGQESMSALQSKLAINAAQFKAGDTQAGDKLTGIAGDIINLGRENSASAVEFARIVAGVRSTLSDAAAFADTKAGPAKDPLDELAAAQAEQKKWADAVQASGASYTQSSVNILAGYTAAVVSQQQASAATAYWADVAAKTGTDLSVTKSEMVTLGESLIKGFFDANFALQIAQIELVAANAIRADLDLRQASALEAFTASIVDVNQTAAAAVAAAGVLFTAAGNKLLEGFDLATLAQQNARDGMTFWGGVVTTTAAGIAASVGAMATAAADIAAAAAANAAAAAAAIGATTAGANEGMVRGWYANNSQFQSNGTAVTSAEVSYWTSALSTMSAADVKAQFAIAAARDAGFSTPLDINSFDVGTSYVPYDQTARIHAGEEITPRPYVDIQRAARDETNELLGRLVASNDALRAEVASLSASSNATARNTDATAKATERSTSIVEQVALGGLSIQTRAKGTEA